MHGLSFRRHREEDTNRNRAESPPRRRHATAKKWLRMPCDECLVGGGGGSNKPEASYSPANDCNQCGSARLDRDNNNVDVDNGGDDVDNDDEGDDDEPLVNGNDFDLDHANGNRNAHRKRSDASRLGLGQWLLHCPPVVPVFSHHTSHQAYYNLLHCPEMFLMCVCFYSIHLML